MKKHIYYFSFIAIFSSLLSTSYVDAQDLFQYKPQVEKEAVEQTDKKPDTEVIINNITNNIGEKVENNDDEIIFIKEEDEQVREPKVYIDTWPSVVQAMKPDYTIIDETIEGGKNINQPIVDTNNLLILGAMQNDLNKVALALKYNSNINIPNKYGATALHWASGKSRYEIVTMILMASNKNSDALNKIINAQDKNGKTPLHYAALYSYDHLNTKLLLKNNANSSLKDNEGRTPLHYAITAFHWDIAEELLKNGAVFNSMDNNNNSVEDLFLERADVNALVKLYSYLSTKNKIIVKGKLKNLNLELDHNNNYIIPVKNSKIDIIPPLRINK